jgi:hypothetical protein
MDAEKALAGMEACCPCRSEAAVKTCGLCPCMARQLGYNKSAAEQDVCFWPGHAAARTLARAAFEAGRNHEASGCWTHTSTMLVPKWLTETSR